MLENIADSEFWKGVGALLWSLVPAAFGSLISLKFAPDDSSPMQRMVTFLIGVGLAYFIGGAVIEYFGISLQSFTADAIKLTIGLFGMSTATQIMTQLPEFLAAVRRKFIGE